MLNTTTQDLLKKKKKKKKRLLLSPTHPAPSQFFGRGVRTRATRARRTAGRYMRAHNSRLTSQYYSSLVKWPPVEIAEPTTEREREKYCTREVVPSPGKDSKKELKTRARAKSSSGDKTFFFAFL